MDDQRLRVVCLDNTNTDSIASMFADILPQWRGLGTKEPRYVPLVRTIIHLQEVGATTAIVQEGVQDPDFFAEHLAYYSRWSYSVTKHCIRIHFFNCANPSESVLDTIDYMSTVDGSYLGFVTLRPISSSPVGATILTPKHNSRTHFILSKDEFQVNLAGRTFYINGTPFMQQDNAVGACAQASIWMALRTLRRREGQAAFNPSQITDAATRFIINGRTLPNRTGLNIDQIMEAIRAAGYSPHAIPVKNYTDAATYDSLKLAKQKLHPYIESGIPVLLTLFPKPNEGHAVLLIGHGWGKEDLIKIEQPKNWPSQNKLFDSASWIEPLFIHNDNTGPYVALPIGDNTNYYKLEDTVIAIPFLPTDVFIDGDEAKETCLRLLTDTLSGYDFNEFNMPDLVFRVYLQDRSDFRTSVLSSNMSNEVKNYYRLKWLPRRIWIMEINTKDSYKDTCDGNGVRMGEIILDPSSEPTEAHFHTIHLKNSLFMDGQPNDGIILDRSAIDGNIEAFPVNEEDYQPLIR